MKILMVCDHYPLSPRVKKIRESILKISSVSDVKIIAWNRTNKEVIEDYVLSVNQNVGYGNKITKVLNISSFFKEAKVLTSQYKPDYVHCIDFEMLILPTFLKSEIPVTYEIYDIKFINNRLLNSLREIIERRLINKYVDNIIYASPFFHEYYNDFLKKNLNIITINNKPLKSSIVTSSVDGNFNLDILNEEIVVGFIGTVRYQEILLNLIEASKTSSNIRILIAGDGPSLEFLKKYVKDNNLKDKVHFTGRYTSKDLLFLYNKCDYIWAAYPNKDLNVKYAVSNKYFESLVFRKKVIVSEGTRLGEKVTEFETGFIVDPYEVNSIKKLFTQFVKNDTLTLKKVPFESLYWEQEEEKLLELFGNGRSV